MIPTAELARTRAALDHARRDLRHAHGRQHPDRHHRGERECPHVIAAHDVVEILEGRVRMLVRAERRRDEAA